MDNKTLPFSDPIIAELAKKHQLTTLQISNDLYLDIVENIISQQLSGKVAKVIFTRFCAIFPNNYPLAQKVLLLPDEKLRETGLSGAKTQYVKALAKFSLENDLSTEYITTLNNEDIINLLIQVKGIGVWTAQMLLIFSLSRPNIFPVDDLAIRIGMQQLYGLKSQGTQLKKEMIAIAEKWHPYQTIGTRYIWLHINNIKNNAVR
jgi:DNA-3-methyladenine glycosylase II